MTIRSSIFRKLLLTSVMLIGVPLAIADLLLTSYTAEHERDLVRQRMAHSLHAIELQLASNPPINLQKWTESADAALDSRVTIIDSSGIVLADSRHDPETMENHASRPEVRDAFGGRPGSDIRHSATLDLDFLYYAESMNLPGRGRAVLRLAIPLKEVSADFGRARSDSGSLGDCCSDRVVVRLHDGSRLHDARTGHRELRDGIGER